ncbi:hypothetical protein [Chromobacterium amazonense]|uniref:Uncharacterized protein n=1 Tax=Chromobacterium amazonense TaxID=1382803 RepID=A0ABU8V6V8_9NEIS|nr:hypothetical protein [Chromobacterium amazonense]MDQ4541198.1 hypothetical protein [Chromobacterium amazonense]
MMSATMTTKPLPENVTYICLPGEDAKGIKVGCKNRVILRKHRDVIFDIKIGNNAEYTIKVEGKDKFYDAKLKKITDTTTFKDGEPCHIWVSRDFNSTLIVLNNVRIISRIPINKLDCTNKCGPDPRDKPAPITITVRSEKNKKANPDLNLPLNQRKDYFSSPSAVSPKFKLESNGLSSMHIVEYKENSTKTPEEVANFFKNGGESTAIDSQKLLTRNWLWAQIGGGMAYINDGRQWLKDLWNQKFYLQKIKHKAGTSTYIIFKGNSGFRSYISGTRYLTTNDKVISISAGAGSLQGIGKGAWEAAKGSFKGAAKYALFLSIALDTAEWLADYEQRDPKTGKPKRDLIDLLAKIFIDVAFAAVSSAIASVGVAFLVGAGILTGGVAVALGGIVLAVGAGLVLGLLDNHVGITQSLSSAMHSTWSMLEQHRADDYKGYANSMNQVLYGQP